MVDSRSEISKTLEEYGDPIVDAVDALCEEGKIRLREKTIRRMKELEYDLDQIRGVDLDRAIDETGYWGLQSDYNFSEAWLRSILPISNFLRRHERREHLSQGDKITDTRYMQAIQSGIMNMVKDNPSQIRTAQNVVELMFSLIDFYARDSRETKKAFCSVLRKIEGITKSEISDALSRTLDSAWEASRALIRKNRIKSRLKTNPNNIIPGLVRFDICDCVSGIYFLMGGHRVQYIGQSTNYFARISQHKKDKRIPFDYALILKCDGENLSRYESALIGAINPPYNRTSGSYNELVLLSIIGECESISGLIKGDIP